MREIRTSGSEGGAESSSVPTSIETLCALAPRFGAAAELAAGGGDVATLRAAHGHGDAMLDQRLDKRIDGMVGRTLHPGREVGVLVERDGVHLGVDAAQQLRQGDGVARR